MTTDPRKAWLDAVYEGQRERDWSGLRVDRQGFSFDVLADDLDAWLVLESVAAAGHVYAEPRRPFLSREVRTRRAARGDVLTRARAILRSRLPVDGRRAFVRGMAAKAKTQGERDALLALLDTPEARTTP